MKIIELAKVFKVTSSEIIHKTGSTVSETILPLNHYVFEEVSSLTITLDGIIEGDINIFSFEFDSGAIPTVFELNIDNPIGYINGSPTIEANSHYYFYIEKSYDGRYFCKWEKYVGGGSYPTKATIISYDSSSITMSRNVSSAEVIQHLKIQSSYFPVTAKIDTTGAHDFIFWANGPESQCGWGTIVNNIISLSNYSGPPISFIQWIN